MRIVLIGSGNVATVLGRKLRGAGHVIVQVYSLNIIHANKLAGELGAAIVTSIKEISQDVDIFLFAIADDELYKLKDWSFTTSGLVAHTGGSVSMEVLNPISENYGVFYPLQSIRKETEILNEVPFLIEGNTDNSRRQLFELALTISGKVQYADGETRKKLHLAAVIANNFSNYLYTLVEEYCKEEGIDFKILLPLVDEGAMRMQHYSPAKLQTGPASRHDLGTIEKHKELLKQYPELLKIYKFFTESILSGNK